MDNTRCASWPRPVLWATALTLGLGLIQCLVGGVLMVDSLARGFTRFTIALNLILLTPGVACLALSYLLYQRHPWSARLAGLLIVLQLLGVIILLLVAAAYHLFGAFEFLSTFAWLVTLAADAVALRLSTVLLRQRQRGFEPLLPRPILPLDQGDGR